MLGYLTAHRVWALGAGLLAMTAAATLAATIRPADPRETVAVIDRSQGETRVEREGVVTRAEAGQRVSRRDQLSTGADARLSLIFHDGSRLAIGENALVVVADFIAEEGRKNGALILDLVRGAIRLIATRPVVAPDKRVEVRSAAATLRSQGADVWSGPSGGKRAVLVMSGEVNVRNDAGWVVLDRRRLGTFVSHRTTTPEKPAGWPSEHVRQALHTVAFK